MLNMCVAFIDAMAEGITSINIKLEEKILKLEIECEKRSSGESEKLTAEEEFRRKTKN